MKYLFSLGLLLSIISCAYGQYFSGLGVSEEGKSNIQGFKIGITPSALMNRWLGYQGKIAYNFNGYEIELNAGYLSGNLNKESYDGYRFRPAFKYYYSERSEGTYYWGIGGLLRQIDIAGRGTFSRFNNTFFQEMDYDLDKRLLGFYAMFGFLTPIINNNFFIDVGAGLGRGKLRTRYRNVPQDAEILYNLPIFTIDSRSEGSITYPIIICHFSFVYKFNP